MNDFIKLFNGLAAHKHRYNVFQDFVTASAIALYNSMYHAPKREKEYLQIIEGYSKEEIAIFPQLLGTLINLLEAEPRDILGELYMELELGNQHAGQFFTPHSVSELMAQIDFDDKLAAMQDSFITLSDPACGAGSTLLAFVKLTIAKGYNPAEKLWIQAIDIDRTVALMCYMVGNSLSAKMRESWFTPAHCLGLWSYRLKNRKMQKAREERDKISEKQQPIQAIEKPVEALKSATGIQLSLF